MNIAVLLATKLAIAVINTLKLLPIDFYTQSSLWYACIRKNFKYLSGRAYRTRIASAEH